MSDTLTVDHVVDDRGNVRLAVTEEVQTYCGHKQWDPFTGSDGPVPAGTKVTLRRDWVGNDGRPGHAIAESTFRGPVPRGLGTLTCGQHVTTMWETWQSASGQRTWRNLVGIQPVGE